MPVDNLSYQGINRAFSDYASQRACEELINLRPTSVGLVPVNPFTPKMENISYDKVYEHRITERPNYIGIRYSHPYIYIYHLNRPGIGTMLIDTITVNGSGFSIGSVHFAYAGNIILFSVKDYATQTYLNRSYLWDGTSYVKKEADVPTINAYIYSQELKVVELPNKTEPLRRSAPEDADRLQLAINTAEEQNPTICFGPIIIAIAFKTDDGNTFWTGQWLVHDPTPFINANAPNTYVIRSGNTGEIETAFADFLSKYPLGYFFMPTLNPDLTPQWKLYGVTLTLYLAMTSAWSESSSVIKSVEIYASRPQPYIDPTVLTREDVEERLVHWTVGLSTFDEGAILMPQMPYSEMELDNKLLYLMKSIPLSSLQSAAQTITLEFGGNTQTANKTLEVDAGMVTRYGDLLSYNARFHYFDSVAKTIIPMPKFTYSGSPYIYFWIFVKYNNGQNDSLVLLGQQYLPATDVDTIIASPIGVKEVIAYRQNTAAMIYTMTASSKYNYSIYTGGNVIVSQTGPFQEYEALIADYQQHGLKDYNLRDEQNAINVTEQYNPFVFKVEHSYLAPGKVLDVQPQMVAVQDTSYGDYPLNVFTNRGVYALLQGNGYVLYSAFRPVSNLVITHFGGGRGGNKSIPTESGTFFLAAGGLWLIAGAKAVLVSDALSMGPHKYIRTCKGFDQLCQGDSLATTPNPQTGTYDVKMKQSQVIFKDYVYKETNGVVSQAVLAYNRYRDELFVSNPAYQYTYVLSLKYRQWFKIDKTIAQDTPGSDIANTPGTVSGTLNILDLSNEQENAHVLVHLQSRPFSFSYQYAHIHRIVDMVRAGLTTSDSLIVGLYGSDDLQNWTLLSFADRKGTSAQNPLQVSQIRTPSSGRSWRYYTVCIGGTTPTDTDFGPVMVDYEPVIRRLG